MAFRKTFDQAKKDVLRLKWSGATTTYTGNMLHKSFDPRMKGRREKEQKTVNASG